MQRIPLDKKLTVSPQISAADITELSQQGFGAIICNRPDDEAAGQPSHHEIQEAAEQAGMIFHYLPTASDVINDDTVAAFSDALRDLPGPILAYCYSGTRSACLWSLARAGLLPLDSILSTAQTAGFDLQHLSTRIANRGKLAQEATDAQHEVLVIGAGAAGISVAASLKKRRANLDIVILDPADVHYYQPGWTMVGGGIFQPESTAKTMADLIPPGVEWIKAAVATFEPERNRVVLEDGRSVGYKQLVVCPGLKLNWDAIEGLRETLGQNGVTSNYRYDLAPYTWELVQKLRGGRAIFTQPPMPIKCAGAPQKALYLSADAWSRNGALKDIDIQFMNAGGVLFGVKDYVPALMDYIKKYKADLNFFHNLVAVDGKAKRATFEIKKTDSETQRVEVAFDMIHVCPPQTAPDFIHASPLADNAGWVNVNPATLRHTGFDNVWSLGDVCNTPNAKTAAAARKQAPVVAENLIAGMDQQAPVARYDGYGSCPLTVERGKIVLAEFGYGGALKPSFPQWLLDGTRPTRLAWLLKAKILPPLYWLGMLRGREWLAKPEQFKSTND